MKKILIILLLAFVALVACTDKKKTTSAKATANTKVELEKVEQSLDEISKEVKTKSKELDDALDALDNI